MNLYRASVAILLLVAIDFAIYCTSPPKLTPVGDPTHARTSTTHTATRAR